MILEGIVTTVSAQGEGNIAPMGPSVDEGMDRFVLRPFSTAQTYQNLAAHGEGVFHVTDDVLLLAQAAIGKIDPPPPMRPATKIRGFVLTNACRFYEFRVCKIDTSEARVRLEVEVLHRGRQRDFFGFNRAKHAVVEAAIMATRLHLIPRHEIDAEFQKLGIIVGKTGGPQETAAFDLLAEYARLKT